MVLPRGPEGGCSHGVNHIVEGSSYVELLADTNLVPVSLMQDVAAHELGHLVGLWHTDVPAATMFATAGEFAVSLATADTAGRCQIYGHAHGYWGGC